MLKTALFDKHIALNAKMAPFAGYEMPIQYTGVNDEHITVREAVGMFDVSHMGEFFVKGEKAGEFINSLCSNDVNLLVPGKVQYSSIVNDNGGIVDDLLIYKISDTEYMLVVNASNIDKDWNWFVSHNNFGVELTNKSPEYALLAVQGPKAVECLQTLTDVNLSDIKYYHFVVGEFAGVKNVNISATGYTGAGGFELYVKNEDAALVWDKIMEAGQKFGIKAAGLAARDTLRLEKGFCLYGNDINDTTTPLEAGLGWITKLNTNFTAKDILVKQKENGLTRKLIGFEMIDRGIPRHDYEVTDGNKNIIGIVTSGTQSPSLKKAIGMAYVKTEFANVGSEIFILIRDKEIKAQVVKIPFL
jgi:aminomethyltransferase